MIYKKTLIISRYHDDLANPIYNAYIKGIQSQCEIIHFIDYFDQISALGKDGFEEQVINLLEKEKIDLVFFIFVSGDPTLDPNFIQSISKKRFIAMVFWDTEQFFEQIDRYYAQLADLVILPANYEYIYKLNLMGINAICPFSLFDSTKYKPSEIQEENIDVSFVGEVTKGKIKEYIQFLLDNGINIEAYGAGTKNGKVSFKKVIDIFNNSKINLSFTGTYDNSIYSFCSNINNRILQNKGKPIEIALCGGFVLTEHVPGIEKVFPPKTIDSFQSKEELLNKINFYLNNEELRHQMKKESYLHAVSNYDSVLAFKTIFKTINSIAPKNEKELILDNIFIKTYNTFRLFHTISFLSQGKILLAWKEAKAIINFPIAYGLDLMINIKYYISRYILWQKLQKDINKLVPKIKNKRVILYGAGTYAIKLLNNFNSLKQLNITAITDSNPSLQNGTFLNKKLIKPQEIEDYGDIVLITSFKFKNEIVQYLKSLDLKNIVIIDIHDEKITEDLLYTKNNQNSDPYQVYRNSLKLK